MAATAGYLPITPITEMKKAEIIFEIEETVVLKPGSEVVIATCPRCRETVEMVSADLLAALTGTSEREVFRLIEAGKLHFIDTNRVLACLHCYQHLTTPHQIRPEKVINRTRSFEEKE